MRLAREPFLAFAVLSAYGVAQAVVGARELEHVAPTTRQPQLPLTNLLGIGGFALAVVLYALVGRAVIRAGAPPSAAARRGGVVGLAAGLVSAVAQATLQADFFREVALAYGLPDSFGSFFVVAILVVEPLAGAITGALIAWLAALLFRPPRPEPA
jgi:hypothetical protein